MNTEMNAHDAYQLGLKLGREQAFAEIVKLLRIDALIADAIRAHEEQHHDS